MKTYPQEVLQDLVDSLEFEGSYVEAIFINMVIEMDQEVLKDRAGVVEKYAELSCPDTKKTSVLRQAFALEAEKVYDVLYGDLTELPLLGVKNPRFSKVLVDFRMKYLGSVSSL